MSGHAAREYKLGKRFLCGVSMPEGMKENDHFQPLLSLQLQKLKWVTMMKIFQEKIFIKKRYCF